MVGNSSKNALIAIIGATGTGKSKLAIELAQRFNGEIINGDAMQMYKGLPIITNKVPKCEQLGIPHHLLDFIELHEKSWTVKSFVAESQRIIREIHSRGKLPILVGGTHYYTHALLFKDALLDQTSDNEEVENREGEGEGDLRAEERFPILSASTPEIYSKLREIDPNMANRWHPNDRRKISRSLEIFLNTGRKASDVYEEQRTMDALDAAMPERKETDYDISHAKGSGLTQPMRYSSLIIWLDAEDSVLKSRLDNRVHNMIANGLLEEADIMADLERTKLAGGLKLDNTNGIWVSIGYKELQPFLAARRAGISPEKEMVSLRNAGIEAVQASTRQYAKRQNRFIRIRLSNALSRAGAIESLFVLDSSNLAQWSSEVTAKSQIIVDSFLRGGRLPNPMEVSEFAKKALLAVTTNSPRYHESFRARVCEVCNKTLMTEKEWHGHLTSRRHRKSVQLLRKHAAKENPPIQSQLHPASLSDDTSGLG